jgi:hypothetical protein
MVKTDGSHQELNRRFLARVLERKTLPRRQKKEKEEAVLFGI